MASKLGDEVLTELVVSVREMDVVKTSGPEQGHKGGVKLAFADGVDEASDYGVEH